MITVPKRYRQTDRQTDRRLTVASPRSALASRGKNNVDPSLILRKGPTKNRYSFNIITVRTAVNLARICLIILFEG